VKGSRGKEASEEVKITYEWKWRKKPGGEFMTRG